jgi:hypothetical protein
VVAVPHGGLRDAAAWITIVGLLDCFDRVRDVAASTSLNGCRIAAGDGMGSCRRRRLASVAIAVDPRDGLGNGCGRCIGRCSCYRSQKTGGLDFEAARGHAPGGGDAGGLGVDGFAGVERAVGGVHGASGEALAGC